VCGEQTFENGESSNYFLRFTQNEPAASRVTGQSLYFAGDEQEILRVKGEKITLAKVVSL